MEWYLKVVRDNYANFDGRARRQEYWMFVLFNLLITLALYIPVIIGAAMESPTIMYIGIGLVVIYALAVFVPSLAVVVRRLHDQGKSGWHYFIAFIPLIGGIWMLILMATEGTHGPNQYGEDPKAGETA
ncbi:DUF805 domain-containing protein [uncultured Dokdonia sp.]|uniref:DUF805 domain-containing protein n=1 Tax=uncultured Dokdonia sp. TaxID=575653 RepID=UPI002621D371|nr:DUF805 domain-containing protein [uncultured Dokdonia sp.]